MAWQTEMVALTRVLVNDMSSTPSYSDDILQQVIITSALQVFVEVGVETRYTADLDEMTLTPDPTDRSSGNRSDAIINLITQKAACIIDRGSACAAANQAIVMKDSAFYVDLRDKIKGKLEILKRGWCAVYDDTKQEYLLGNQTTAGALVMTPFRVYPWGNPGFDADGRDAGRKIFM